MEDQPEKIEEVEKPEQQLSVFISYKRGGYDEALALQLFETFNGSLDIFIDQVMPPGTEWPKAIEAKLRRADFVVALISAESVESQNVLSEIQIADRLYREEGRPSIIPVRLAYSAPYDLRLNAYLSRFNEVMWTADDHANVIQQLEAAFSERPVLLSEITTFGMDDFLISDSRRSRIKATFIEPSRVATKIDPLLEERLLWITGDAGVRDYIALALAAKKDVEKVYEVPKSRSWSKICDTKVRNSSIIFRDAIPASHFNEETSFKELRSLSKLVEQGNFVIVTSSTLAFSEAQLEMHKSDFKYYTQVELGYESYDTEAKLRIFKSLVEYSWETGEITERQYSWVRSVVDPTAAVANGMREKVRKESNDRLNGVVRKWSPADIERFVILNLHHIETPGDILKLLRRNATLDDEIHSWFLTMDDSTRCFIMAMALFSEIEKDELWRKYKSLVYDLKKMNPQIALIPFGICRERAAPYVSTDGSIIFVDARVAQAVSNEVAKSYLEYFIEIIPRLKEWSAPAKVDPATGNMTEEDRRRLIDETREVRLAIARMVGHLVRLNSDEFEDILDHWATDSSNAIRDAVGIALEQTASNKTEAANSLNLLWRWYAGTSSDKTAYRASAIALALGRIASAALDDSISSRALNYLRRLTEDKRDRVRLFVSLAVKQMARRVHLPDLEDLLTRLARDRKPAVRINVADALNTARFLHSEFVADLLGQWAISDDLNLRWAAICSLIIFRKAANRKPQQDATLVDEVCHELQTFSEQAPALVADAFMETIGHDRFGPTASLILEQLLLQSTDESGRSLLSAFADVSPDQLESKLFSYLRSSGRPRLASLLIDIRLEQWRRLLNQPETLLSEISEGLEQEQLIPEVYKTLMLMLNQESNDSRPRLIDAFITCYVQGHKGVKQLLKKLQETAPSGFEYFCYEVRQESVGRLLEDSTAFVEFLKVEVEQSSELDSALPMLEALAYPEPQGKRKSLIRVLADQREIRTAEIDTLLQHPAFADFPHLASLLPDIKQFGNVYRNFAPKIVAG